MEYQPKIGAKCGCKRGVQRDNCPNCEGTGWVSARSAGVMTRDLSRKQFEARLKAHGFEPVGFLGYWRVPTGTSRVSISELNGGPRLRDRLAYLLREADKHQ